MWETDPDTESQALILNIGRYFICKIPFRSSFADGQFPPTPLNRPNDRGAYHISEDAVYCPGGCSMSKANCLPRALRPGFGLKAACYRCARRGRAVSKSNMVMISRPVFACYVAMTWADLFDQTERPPQSRKRTPQKLMLLTEGQTARHD
jgi:hypothetical protein